MNLARRIFVCLASVVTLSLATLAYMWLAYDTQALVGGGIALAILVGGALGAWNKVFS